MFKCDCDKKFQTSVSRGNHRRFCKVFQDLKKKSELENDKTLKFKCHICSKKFKFKAKLTIHYCKPRDKKHLQFYEKEQRKIIKALKKGLAADKIETKLSERQIWKIWHNNFSKKEISTIRKRFQYAKKKIFCNECNRKIFKRKGNKICSKCRKKKLKQRKKIIYKKCERCQKKLILKTNLTGLCFKCLQKSPDIKKQISQKLSQSMKGKNKGNPGWARVKTKNNYIEQRVANYLFEHNYKIECQKRIKRYRVDIFLKNKNIIIECDGRQHYEILENFQKDKKRDNELIQLGYRIMRFNAIFILNFLKSLNKKINQFINNSEKRTLYYWNKNGKKFGAVAQLGEH